MVFDGPKPLKSIEKQTFFLILGHSKKPMKKQSKKGSPKSSKIDWKRQWGRQGSIYSSIVSILGPVEQSSFFDVALGRRKSIKIEPWGAKGRKKVPGPAPEWWLWGSRVQGRLARGTIKQ